VLEGSTFSGNSPSDSFIRGPDSTLFYDCLNPSSIVFKMESQGKLRVVAPCTGPNQALDFDNANDVTDVDDLATACANAPSTCTCVSEPAVGYQFSDGGCTTVECDKKRGFYYTAGSSHCTTKECSNKPGTNEEYTLKWTTTEAGCTIDCVEGAVRKDNICTKETTAPKTNPNTDKASGRDDDDDENPTNDGAVVAGVVVTVLVLIAGVGIALWWVLVYKRDGSGPPWAVLGRGGSLWAFFGRVFGRGGSLWAFFGRGGSSDVDHASAKDPVSANDPVAAKDSEIQLTTVDAGENDYDFSEIAPEASVVPVAAVAAEAPEYQEKDASQF